MASPAATVRLEGEARRLTTYVRRMERRYGRASAEMLEAVRCGEARETRDVRKWLDAYAALGDAWPEGAEAAIRARLDEMFDGPPPRPRPRSGKVKSRTVQPPTKEEMLRKAAAYVRRMERRYECSSAEMMEAVRDGRAKQTAQICDWALAYRDLKRLQGHPDPLSP